MADSARIEELKRRVLVDPASIAFAALAEEYRRAGQFEAAIATCQAGLQRHPAYLSARVTLGRALLELGRYDEARVELELVLRTAPENLAAIRGLAEIHHRVGDLPETAPPTPAAPADPVAPAPVVQPPTPPVPVAPPPAPVSIAAPPPPAPVAVAPPAPAPVVVTPPTRAPVVVAPPPAPAPVVTPVRQPHPDEAALPALEAFLAAIVAVRATAR